MGSSWLNGVPLFGLAFLLFLLGLLRFFLIRSSLFLPALRVHFRGFRLLRGCGLVSKNIIKVLIIFREKICLAHLWELPLRSATFGSVIEEVGSKATVDLHLCFRVVTEGMLIFIKLFRGLLGQGLGGLF